VIIATFTQMDDQAARHFKPKVILVDEKNRIKQRTEEVPGPGRRK
jgi:aspartate 1-decarboxylase